MEGKTYTKAPWRITEKPLQIVGTPESPHCLPPVVARLTLLDLENAERIVACINACEGKSNKELLNP